MSAAERKLPCFPCPHHSVCCTWGVSLTTKEAHRIMLQFGPQALYFDQDEEGYRTRTDEGVCFFLKGNRCTIHNGEYYPEVCRGFPANHTPEDQLICPEIKKNPSHGERGE